MVIIAVIVGAILAMFAIVVFFSVAMWAAVCALGAFTGGYASLFFAGYIARELHVGGKGMALVFILSGALAGAVIAHKILSLYWESE